jgi:hypothetical protein
MLNAELLNGPIAQMGDCGEAYLHAVCSEKDMLIHKEAVNCQFYLTVELDQLIRKLDNALNCPLGVGTSHASLELEY